MSHSNHQKSSFGVKLEKTVLISVNRTEVGHKINRFVEHATGTEKVKQSRQKDDGADGEVKDSRPSTQKNGQSSEEEVEDQVDVAFE